MENGKSLFQGHNVSKAIDNYYNHFVSNESNIVFTDNSIELLKYELINPLSHSLGIPQIEWGSDFQLYFNFRVTNAITNLEFFVIITDKEQRSVALLDLNKETCEIKSDNGIFEFKVSHEKLQLSKGIYTINFAIRNRVTKEPVFRINNILPFQVLHEEEIWEPFLLKSKFENI